jgi:hypothetical protein
METKKSSVRRTRRTQSYLGTWQSAGLWNREVIYELAIPGALAYSWCVRFTLFGEILEV